MNPPKNCGMGDNCNYIGSYYSKVTVFIMVNLTATKNALESVSSTVVSVGCRCIRVLKRYGLKTDNEIYNRTLVHRSWQI